MIIIPDWLADYLAHCPRCKERYSQEQIDDVYGPLTCRTCDDRWKAMTTANQETTE